MVLQTTAIPFGHLSKGKTTSIQFSNNKGAKPQTEKQLRKRLAPKFSLRILLEIWERENRSRWINARYGDNRRTVVLPILRYLCYSRRSSACLNVLKAYSGRYFAQ